MAINVQEPMVTEQFTVQRVKRETLDTYTLELSPPTGKKNFSFKPGQFNMLYAFGKGEVPISISGDSKIQTKITHTIRMLGSVTQSLCATTKGGIIGVRGPFGTSWPMAEAEGNDVVIVTGGIGLAPLRPAIYHLLANREKYGKIVLLYGARSPEEMLFVNELEQWRGRFDLDVQVTVDAARTGWLGNVALVTALIPKANFDPYNTTALICGPEIMMRFTLIEFKKRGIDDSRIYVSMERNMKCGIGHCGHCQFGPYFICKDGPVFNFKEIKKFFEIREI
jgi:NAD(P)H-flavin reductase